MHLQCRQVRSPRAVELYMTATPDPAADAAGEAAAMFTAIQNQAATTGGRICRQRIFVPDGCDDAYRQAWDAICRRSTTGFRNTPKQTALGGGTDPASPACTWLRAGSGAAGGVQAHVIAGQLNWTALLDDSGAAAGWACRDGTLRWAAVGPIRGPHTADDAAATQQAFEAAERLLAQADMGLGDVARTWFFLDDILAWYGPFNTGRNSIFRSRGLLGPSVGAAGPLVPASTGVGVSPLPASRMAMELFAVGGPQGCVVRSQAAGKQRSAYDYGSAFARVSRAATPGGQTVFVSGTAAIDEHGHTCFIDDAAGQIRMTLDNVRAVLSDAKCQTADVAEAIAYCKTPAIAAQFHQAFANATDWPWLTVVCDICRDDLLFEVEVTAARAVA